jgi:Zn-dependent metalloprotease
MKKLKFIILFLLFSATWFGIKAQPGNKYLIRNTNETGIPTYLKFNTRICQLTDPYEIFGQEFKIRDVDELRKVKTITRNLKSGDIVKHEKYQQYYNGIKVEEGLINVHYTNNIAYSLNGLYLDNINISINPEVVNTEALSNALKLINAETYYWDEYGMVTKPEGDLVIVKLDSVQNSYHLAYKFIINAIKPVSSDLIYVDANNDSILSKHSLIYYDFPTSGPANTIFSGERTIYTTFDNSEQKYKLLDDERDIHTYNNNYYDELGYQSEFYDEDNFWTESPEWDAEPGLDAHWGGYIVDEYLNDIVNINSYDDLGGAYVFYVHWDEEWENAGTNLALKYIEFGDGGSTLGTRPWVSLDIVSHEIGHLISYCAGLGDLGSESGAVIEGFSDIWAICIEWNYVNNIESDPYKEPYLTAEQICIWDDFGRSSINPNSEGLNGFKGADTYEGEYWNYDPPYSKSTVISHWFYILNEGKTGTNDLGNDFSVIGINDPLEGSRILYKLCDERLEGSYITFQDVKEQTIDLLQQDYGEFDTITLNAIQAWYAVGVPGNCLTQCCDTTFNTDYYLYLPGCNINIDNVNITGSGTDVIFEADEITIESDFEVTSGATLEIINP